MGWIVALILIGPWIGPVVSSMHRGFGLLTAFGDQICISDVSMRCGCFDTECFAITELDYVFDRALVSAFGAWFTVVPSFVLGYLGVFDDFWPVYILPFRCLL